VGGGALLLLWFRVFSSDLIPYGSTRVEMSYIYIN